MPDKNEKHETYQKKCVGKNKFFSMCAVLHKFESKVALAGQYSFPFTMALPQWLP